MGRRVGPIACSSPAAAIAGIVSQSSIGWFYYYRTQIRSRAANVKGIDRG
ncbi:MULTISPECIES: hypothetical protein [Microcoleaceae]|nr:hypothetical protein [Tychonema sp. LEGE 06208]MBE9161831.1 hypothetical protein [Tychonema sp. LEGE 06208]